MRRREREIAAGRLFGILLAAAASHGLVDAAMASGLGVATLAPFSAARYTFSWRPIRVPPAVENPWLNLGGIRVTASEVLWLWLPSLALMLAGLRLRHVTRGGTPAAS